MKLGAAAVFVAVVAGVGRSLWPRAEIPAHMRHDAILLPDLIEESDFDALRGLVQRFGAEGYSLNTNDLKSYTTEHEHSMRRWSRTADSWPIPQPITQRLTDRDLPPAVGEAERLHTRDGSTAAVLFYSILFYSIKSCKAVLVNRINYHLSVLLKLYHRY